MNGIYKSVESLIGSTPLLELVKTEEEFGLKAKIFAKLEFFNPAGSSKDRVAKAMLDDAEKSGKINKDTVIIEPTSGNTGIGLAAVCAARGYKLIIVMPSDMSKERQLLMKAYGAELVLSDAEKGMSGAIEKANEIAKENGNCFIAGQFTNKSNPVAHFNTTGPEIYADTEGNADIFVCGIGTGGTITGTGEYLKSKIENIKIVGVEPATSAVLSGKSAGAHGLMGIGAGFIPEVLNTNVYDEIITVSDDEAYEKARFVAKKEGVLIGISSGAALNAAVLLAKRKENEGKNIVVLFPDSGERYLSTGLYD